MSIISIYLAICVSSKHFKEQLLLLDEHLFKLLLRRGVVYTLQCQKRNVFLFIVFIVFFVGG